jgi:TolB-like protein
VDRRLPPREDPPEGSALREWVAGERARLRTAYRRLLDRQVAQAEAAGAWADAVTAAERLAGLDPLDAAAVARLAAVLRRAGDPAAALARVDALAARRRAELDAGLPPRLTALAEELKAEVAAREAEAARAALRQLAGAGAAADADAGPAAQHDAERARLLAAWRHVGVGADPVLVTGGTGAGRTRLLADLEHAARRDGALVLAARGYAADRETPWATARLLLAPLADAPGLAGLAPAALARLATVVPAVRDAFPALPAPGAPADDWAVLEAARAAVEEVAAEVPVLVGVDDLPRADAMTRQLVARARPAPAAAGPVCGGRGGRRRAGRDARGRPAARRGRAAPDRPRGRRAADRPPAAATPAAMPTATPPTASAAAPVATVPRARRLRVALAAAAALGVVAFGASRLVRGSWTPAADALDASLVAVAPFDVVESDLALWRHGVVDVLARRLDGAGELRTVSPTTVIRRFEGRGDPASAAALGERTGAGLVVYGGIVRAGADSVRLEARLFDARRGEVVGEVRVHDALAGMDRALDALGIGLLRELARARPLGAVRTAGVAAASLPALRDFLAAEQHYRAGDFAAARAAADRAVALDSAFVLARHRLGTLLLYDQYMETGARHLMRAAVSAVAARRAATAATAPTLSPRDSVVVSLDSLRGAALLAGRARADGVPPAELAGPYLERMRRALLDLGDDPELRLAHAEALVFMGATARSTRDEQYAAFERAIALDSAFFPAYVQAVGIALATHHVDRARHHLAAMRALGRGPTAPARSRRCSA